MDNAKAPFQPHVPTDVQPSIIFREKKILGKSVWISDKSKVIIATKKHRKSATVDRTYPVSHLNDAVGYYLDLAKKRKKNTDLYLLIHTDELYHECLVDSTEK